MLFTSRLFLIVSHSSFEAASVRAALNLDPDFRYCLSPACTTGQIHPNGTDEPIFSCYQCGYQHCVVCEIPWHAGETCAQRQSRLKTEQAEAIERADPSGIKRRRLAQEEAASARMVQTVSKCCPQCTTRIEKDGGCDHMTCR